MLVFVVLCVLLLLNVRCTFYGDCKVTVSTAERQVVILKKLKYEGYVSITPFSDRLDVSEMTGRR